MKERLSNSLLFLACTILMTACASAHSNEIVAEGEVPVRLADSYNFTEGPATDAKGNVYFTDQPNNRIYRWDCESGEITLFTDQSGRSNGMYFDAQGNLIVCADMDNQLWRFNMNGQAEILITDYREKLLNGPNDVWIAKDGSYYLTDLISSATTGRATQPASSLWKAYIIWHLKANSWFCSTQRLTSLMASLEHLTGNICM